MRKYLYAGAVAGGFLLLGTAPAHADGIPSPINAQQDGSGLGILGPDGALGIGNPLGGAKVLNIDPGSNSPDLTGATGYVLPGTESDVPAARTGLGQAGAQRPALPATDQLSGGLPTGGLPGTGGSLPVGQLPFTGVFSGGLLGGGLLGGGPLGGLSSNGRMPATGAGQESALLMGDSLPLLGGLLPASSAPTLPAFSGLPAGGTAVPATGVPAPVDAKPAAKPAAAKPAADPATANDARLHEEPTDPEGKAGTRTFSAGRPVAGVDPSYK